MQELELLEKLRSERSELSKSSASFMHTINTLQRTIATLEKEQDKVNDKCKNLQVEINELKRNIIRKLNDIYGVRLVRSENYREKYFIYEEKIEVLHRHGLWENNSRLKINCYYKLHTYRMRWRNAEGIR